jgi:hypothetical protein
MFYSTWHAPKQKCNISVIALNWKDELTDKQNTVNIHTKWKISPDQNRDTTCNRKLPVTRSKDFLW